MRSPFRELIWTEHAEEHIASHAITPAEFEEAMADRGALLLRARGPEGSRYVVLGRTDAERYLMAVIAPAGSGIGRPITARSMTTGEKRRYRRWG